MSEMSTDTLIAWGNLTDQLETSIKNGDTDDIPVSDSLSSLIKLLNTGQYTTEDVYTAIETLVILYIDMQVSAIKKDREGPDTDFYLDTLYKWRD